MTQVQVLDNAVSQLQSKVAAGAVALALLPGMGTRFPLRAGYHSYVRLGTDNANEVVRFTARNGDVLACEPTARAWPAGTHVIATICSALLNDLKLDGQGDILAAANAYTDAAVADLSLDTIAADHVTYANAGHPGIANVQQALDTLLYVAPQASITNSVGTVEIGSTVAAVTLDWTVNKAVVAQSIAAPGPGAIDPALRTLALSGLRLTADTTFTLAVDDGAHAASASTQVLFRHRRRWGVSARAVPDAALIDALAGAEFAAGRAQSRSFSPSGQYVYFAWPSSFGTPTFLVNGLLNTAWVKTTVGYTNPSGYTADFDVYRSQFLQSGGQQVVVQ